MQTNRLGCLTGTGLMAALVTSFVIAGFAYARGGLMYNPGPLSTQGDETLGGVKSHAEIGGDCKACHTAPWESAVMADRCARCHTNIADQMRDVASMHGTLLHDNPDLGCRHCHPEHRGPDAQLTLMEEAAFPHEVVGFSLNGHQLTAARVPFTCDDCHHGDITTFAPDSCDSCHRQVDLEFMTAHTLSFGAACLDCHDGVDRLGKNFDHSVFSFKITGKHVSLACVQCHIDARVMGDFEATHPDCYSCHYQDEPHEGRFGLDCSQCHTADGWSPAKFDHNLAAFKLEGRHSEAACESCHVKRQFKGTPMDCYSCHQQDDEHNGQFGTDCSACHNPSSWDHVDFDHNRSNFPLTGAHAGVACERCHSSGQFAGLSTACASCHGDPAYHAGLFGLDCAGCHRTDNWFARYNGPHPGVADEGGRGVNHGGASCRDCHTKTLHTAICTKCHEGNKPGDGGGEGGGD
jgi:cytochrome c3-like protein